VAPLPGDSHDVVRPSWRLELAARRHGDAGPLLDDESFRRAVVQHGRSVHRFLASRLGPDAADDAMSETFAQAWKARAKFVDPTDNGLEAWLIHVASYVVHAHRRQEQRWLQMKADTAREVASAELLADDAADRVEAILDADTFVRRARIAEAFVEMPRRERDPLLMLALDGHPYSEIARRLGLPIGTVRSRISRARQRLAQHMERTGERR
jgi:RNA polymerase sigma-70 factor (ECF subfamily)